MLLAADSSIEPIEHLVTEAHQRCPVGGREDGGEGGDGVLTVTPSEALSLLQALGDLNEPECFFCIPRLTEPPSDHVVVMWYLEALVGLI